MNNEKAELKIWKLITLRLSSRQYLILMLVILFIFFAYLLKVFPSYQNAILGNQSISQGLTTIMVFFPLGLVAILFLLFIIMLILNKK